MDSHGASQEQSRDGDAWDGRKAASRFSVVLLAVGVSDDGAKRRERPLRRQKCSSGSTEQARRVSSCAGSFTYLVDRNPEDWRRTVSLAKNAGGLARRSWLEVLTSGLHLPQSPRTRKKSGQAQPHALWSARCRLTARDATCNEERGTGPTACAASPSIGALACLPHALRAGRCGKVGGRGGQDLGCRRPFCDDHFLEVQLALDVLERVFQDLQTPLAHRQQW